MVVPGEAEIPTLLYVDDNADDRCLLEAAVARARATFRIICLSGLPEAIDYLNGQGKFENKRLCPPPNLLLLDYHLGVHTALDLLRWLQQSKLTLPVIIFSGAHDTRIVEPCFQAGADGWLEKSQNPSAWNDITAALQLCLASVPAEPAQLASLSRLSNRRLRAELRASIDQHRVLMQQRREMVQLLDGTLAEQKEAKKKFPFRPPFTDSASRETI